MTSRLSEAIAGALLLCQWVLAALAIPKLPAVVPTHFGRSGAPDATGPASTLWLLPAVATAMYLFLALMQRIRPDRMNLPVTVNDRNRDRVYGLARELQSVLKASVMLIFLTLEWGTLDSAGRGMLGPAFIAGITTSTALLVVILVAYTLRMRSV